MCKLENTVFNLVLKLTLPLVQNYCVQIVHYMICFQYQTTFKVLHSLMILTCSWTQDKFNWQVTGQFVLELFLNTDQTLKYSAAFNFFQFICSFTDWIIMKLWEANRSSVSQDVPCVLWNWKVHYYIHKHLPPVPTLSLSNPIHASASHYLKVHFNNIFPSVPSYSRWFPSLRCFCQNPVYTSSGPHMYHMTSPSNSSWFDQPNDFGEKYRS